MSSFTMGPSADALAPKFDGTISSLADCYLSDVDSAYQQLKENGADGYKPWLKMVRKPVAIAQERPLCGRNGHSITDHYPNVRFAPPQADTLKVSL
jgi:hypothetical protein